jgi:hypothetical protein
MSCLHVQLSQVQKEKRDYEKLKRDYAKEIKEMRQI